MPQCRRAGEQRVQRRGLHQPHAPRLNRVVHGTHSPEVAHWQLATQQGQVIDTGLGQEVTKDPGSPAFGTHAPSHSRPARRARAWGLLNLLQLTFGPARCRVARLSLETRRALEEADP